MEFLSLSEAIDRFVPDGAQVALEGFTHLIPFAAGHELIRQGRRDLHLVRMTPDLIYDQLIGTGCARALTFSWGGNPGVGSLHRLRDAVERGWPRPLELDEHTHAGMAAAYCAGAARLPFGLLRGYIGTDLVEHNPRISAVRCPYTGADIATVPALNPDVTILHAQRADAQGNVAIDGIVGAQREAALAARCLVVTVEEVVESLPPAMNGIVLPHWLVAAVVPCPRRRVSFLRARLLRARQCLLPALGRDRARPRALSGVDPASRSRHHGSRRVSREPEGGGVSDYTRDEMMTIAAARMLWDGCVCFVGIGLPSAACNLARLTHAPDVVLIYESGTIGTRPQVLPLSIGDGELAETAACVVPLPEVFSYYLQAGRVDVGFLGAAQIDRYGNLNSTVIGPYEQPGNAAARRRRRAGDRRARAADLRRHEGDAAQLRGTARFPHQRRLPRGHGARARSGATGAGPRAVITDFGILTPLPETDELALSALFPGITVDEARAAVGWPLASHDEPVVVPSPTAEELSTLRALHARTAAAHARPVQLPNRSISDVGHS